MVIILRNDAAGVPCFVGHWGVVDREDHVQRLLAGDLMGEGMLVHNGRQKWISARVYGGGGWGVGDGGWCGYGGGGSIARRPNGYDVCDAMKEGILPLSEGFLE